MSQSVQQTVVGSERLDWRPGIVFLLLQSYFAMFGLFVGVTGVLWAEIIRTLQLSEGVFGTALLVMPLVGIGILLFYGRFYTRFGARRLMVVGLAIYIGAIVVLASMADLWGFIAALILLGIGISLMEGAMNSAALDWEQATGRSIMNLIHAMFSIGAILGAFTAGAALDAGWTYAQILLGLAVLSGPVLLLTLPVRFPPAEADAAPAASNAIRFLFSQRALLFLALVIGLSILVESIAGVWSVIYLREELGAAAVIGGATFALFNITMFVGRLLNAPLVARKGPMFSLMLSGGGLILSALILVATGYVSLAVLGFGLMGLAVAGIFPTVMSAAAKLAPGNSGAVTGAMMLFVYAGFMIGPPLIGWLAELTSLQGSLFVVGLCGLGTLWLTRQLPSEPTKKAS